LFVLIIETENQKTRLARLETREKDLVDKEKVLRIDSDLIKVTAELDRVRKEIEKLDNIENSKNIVLLYYHFNNIVNFVFCFVCLIIETENQKTRLARLEADKDVFIDREKRLQAERQMLSAPRSQTGK